MIFERLAVDVAQRLARRIRALGMERRQQRIVRVYRVQRTASLGVTASGDGALSYGHENIFETFYTAHLWRGLFASFDLQHMNNPGYNRDRGPVLVPGLRGHVEF